MGVNKKSKVKPKFVGLLLCDTCEATCSQLFTEADIEALVNDEANSVGTCSHCGNNAELIDWYEHWREPPPRAAFVGWATTKAVNNLGLPAGVRVAVIRCPNVKCRKQMAITKEQHEMSGWCLCKNCCQLFESGRPD